VFGRRSIRTPSALCCAARSSSVSITSLPLGTTARTSSTTSRETSYPYPENPKLVTTVGGRRDDQGAWLPAQSPAPLRAGVEDHLGSLRGGRMAFANLRVMTADGSGDLLAGRCYAAQAALRERATTIAVRLLLARARVIC
jgi:hypothetical protein